MQTLFIHTSKGRIRSVSCFLPCDVWLAPSSTPHDSSAISFASRHLSPTSFRTNQSLLSKSFSTSVNKSQRSVRKVKQTLLSQNVDGQISKILDQKIPDFIAFSENPALEPIQSFTYEQERWWRQEQESVQNVQYRGEKSVSLLTVPTRKCSESEESFLANFISEDSAEMGHVDESCKNTQDSDDKVENSEFANELSKKVKKAEKIKTVIKNEAELKDLSRPRKDKISPTKKEYAEIKVENEQVTEISILGIDLDSKTSTRNNVINEETKRKWKATVNEARVILESRTVNTEGKKTKKKRPRTLQDAEKFKLTEENPKKIKSGEENLIPTVNTEGKKTKKKKIQALQDAEKLKLIEENSKNIETGEENLVPTVNTVGKKTKKNKPQALQDAEKFKLKEENPQTGEDNLILTLKPTENTESKKSKKKKPQTLQDGNKFKSKKENRKKFKTGEENLIPTIKPTVKNNLLLSKTWKDTPSGGGSSINHHVLQSAAAAVVSDYAYEVDEDSDFDHDSDSFSQDVPTHLLTHEEKREKSLQLSMSLRDELRRVYQSPSKDEEFEELIKQRSQSVAQFNEELPIYLEICSAKGDVKHAEAVLTYYLGKNRKWQKMQRVEKTYYQKKHKDQKPPFSLDEYIMSPTSIVSPAPFNAVLRGLAKQNAMERILEWLEEMKALEIKPDVYTYAHALECAHRLLSTSPEDIKDIVLPQLNIDMINDGVSVKNLLQQCRERLLTNELIHVKEALLLLNIQPMTEKDNENYQCPIVNHLNEVSSCYPNPFSGVMDKKQIMEKFREALELERKGTLSVDRIDKVNRNSNNIKEKDLKRHIDEWNKALHKGINNRLAKIKQLQFDENKMNVLPYFDLLTREELVELLLNEIAHLAQYDGSYSLPMHQVASNLGKSVVSRGDAVQILTRCDASTFETVYSRYLDFCCASERSVATERRFWTEMMEEFPGVHDLQVSLNPWPQGVILTVGRILLDVIMEEALLYPNAIIKSERSRMPAFYKINRFTSSHKRCWEVKAHPSIQCLFKDAVPHKTTFDVTNVPMTVPPLPWMPIDFGGNLLQSNVLVRVLGYDFGYERNVLNQVPKQQLFPVIDALNHLGSCPWRVNSIVLDVAVSVFNSGGDPKLDIPTSSTIWEEKLSALPKLTRDMPSEERRKIFAAQRENRKAKAESHSLYCSSLYKLSLAQHFRNDVLWYPLNMDFRGRVYPCPPHLNHMGNDLTRGLLKFAKGKPLGDGGLDWLKIHVVNMTGLKKRDKVENRLIYANEIIDEIVDSGVDPLGGRRWWMESEEPWQTLAACKEIAAAIESEDAKEFISHLPVHQDGSCNGLQHYAALGRDQLGAESVNLCPSEFPNDVYSDVLERVEEQRRSDAENGVAEAQVLEGLLSRKVIKQTIMTTVYGVTIYGARIQVENRLKEIPQMPRDKMFNCSFYLAKTTFACLAERFTTTKEIQDWLVDCAVLITKMCKNTVSWETPLGLPVSQPYFKMKTMKAKFKNNDRLALADRKYSAGELLENEQNLLTCPNSKKNQNAFPPNFIHSLDSTHMMLTTLHAHRQGICFNAVHDCYWTHASDIDQLNDICRQQFLKLHSLPILEDLSQHLLKVNSWEQTEPVSGQRLATQQRMSRLLKAVMENVPHRGEYNIEDVLDSVYFFS